MVELRFKGVSASSDVSIQRDFMIPPIMVMSNSRYCNVIQVSYEIVVEADVSGCHTNLEVRIPIVIGSVPIISEQIMTDAAQMNAQPGMTSVPIVTQYNNDFAMAPVMPPLRKFLYQINEFSSIFIETSCSAAVVTYCNEIYLNNHSYSSTDLQ